MKRGYEVEVPSLPNCDLCKKREARFDGKTAFGPWAYMCHVCYTFYGVGLGTGRGQELVLAEKSKTNS